MRAQHRLSVTMRIGGHPSTLTHAFHTPGDYSHQMRDPCGIPEFGRPTEQEVSRRPFILVDQATKNRSALDPFKAEVDHGVGRSWRAKFAGAVRGRAFIQKIRRGQFELGVEKAAALRSGVLP